MIEIAVLGHGVVGSGVVEVLTNNYESITRRAKEEIKIKYILDKRDFPDSPLSDRFTKDYNQILNDQAVKIVVEVMGGLEPAFTFVKEALLKGKSVVTSNKELVAAKGQELLEIANKNNVNFLFEASVGGGIPIIRPMNQCLAANEVIEIAGILNGTTNFILTKMIHESMEFDTALELAQKLGYAERDPSADVDGGDACRKICILASLAYGKHVYPQDVHTTGIRDISLDDVEYAKIYHSVIKLIGQVKKLDDGKIEVVVEPMFIKKDSQLAGIEDVFNGILVKGDATGDVVFYGKGAGKLPTASAVVADIIDAIKHFDSRKYLYWGKSEENYVKDYEDCEVSTYIRAVSEDSAESMKKVEGLFGKVKRIVRYDCNSYEFAFIVKDTKRKDIDQNIEKLKNDNIEILSVIRIADF